MRSLGKPLTSKRVVRGSLLFFVACLLLVGVREAALGFYRVEGASMQPTLLLGDLLLADKTAFGLRLPLVGSLAQRPSPARGEIVVLRLRHHRNRLIKRIVGLPGDTVAMRAGRLHVNGTPVVEPYVQETVEEMRRNGAPGPWHFSYLVPDKQNYRYAPTGANWGPIVIPEARYFVLGDNRDASGDSRGFGFVRPDELVARPFLLLYSYDPHGPARVPFVQNVRVERLGRGL